MDGSGGSWASSPAVRSVMLANPGKDTRPERALRSALHARGLRYRVGVRPIAEVRRTADVVFPGAKTAVFLDGCFWHGCPEHYRPATGASSEFWCEKIAQNQRRDADTDQRLANAGWTVVRIWEHEPVEQAAQLVSEIVRARRASTKPPRPERHYGSTMTPFTHVQNGIMDP